MGNFTERNDFVIGTNQEKANVIFVKKRSICYDCKLICQQFVTNNQ